MIYLQRLLLLTLVVDNLPCLPLFKKRSCLLLHCLLLFLGVLHYALIVVFPTKSDARLHRQQRFLSQHSCYSNNQIVDFQITLYNNSGYYIM